MGNHISEVPISSPVGLWRLGNVSAKILTIWYISGDWVNCKDFFQSKTQKKIWDEYQC